MNISTTTPSAIPFIQQAPLKTETPKNVATPHASNVYSGQQQRNGLQQNKTFRNVMYFGSAISSVFYTGLSLYIVWQVGKIRQSVERLNLQQKQQKQAQPKPVPPQAT
jgi:hypothetical protein